MSRSKAHPAPSVLRTRESILDAAEGLLAEGKAAFSMRELATTAGVSFVTPFNQFGSKGAIMLALSARRIDLMRERFEGSAMAGDVVDRTSAMVDIAASVMLEARIVNRAVMGALGSPTGQPGAVSSRSVELWTLALGHGDGLSPSTRSLALATLPGQLAVAFRGVLSFWTAGEISDDELNGRAQSAAAVSLLGFVTQEARQRLIKVMKSLE